MNDQQEPEFGSYRVLIHKRYVDAMTAHVSKESPNMACGFLAAKEGVVVNLYRIANVNKSPSAWLMDRDEQLKAMIDMELRGYELFGIYSSRLIRPAYPSSADVRQASPEPYYFLIGVYDDSPPQIRAFRIVEENVTEVPIEITDGPVPDKVPGLEAPGREQTVPAKVPHRQSYLERADWKWIAILVLMLLLALSRFAQSM